MRAVLVLVALALTGCAGGIQQADRAVETLTSFVSAVDQPLRDAYQRELAACPDEACAQRVDSAWAPIIAGMVEIHDQWCSIDTDNDGCKR